MLAIGPLRLATPVVLAPMAGVTSAPFRVLCRRYDAGGLYVSEMLSARALHEDDRGARLRAAFWPGEQPRSIQLYATEPWEARAAVARLVEEGRVDHVDLNFGCPMKQVTRHGGGAALPWKLGLFRAIVAAAVAAAGAVPVTVKMRTGIDAEHLTYLDAARAAVDAGVAAVALHARTAADLYGGHADWSAIAKLVDAVGDEVPVLGNGDIWQAADALAMLGATGCAGVVVGRGCLGRPWLFAQLAAALAGRPEPDPPGLGEVSDLIVEHARMAVTLHEGDEHTAVRKMRKHIGWYLQGFPVGRDVRKRFNSCTTLAELEDVAGDLHRDQPLPAEARDLRRGHQAGPQHVVLPHGWLEDRAGMRLAAAAGVAANGG